MTEKELVEKIHKYACEGETGDRDKTPWTLLPPNCKFSKGKKSDIIINVEWKHPEIKEEDIQNAFKSLGEIIEREHKEKGVITKNFKRLTEVVITLSECDSTITSELLSNYEQFCQTIVKYYTIEGKQYVEGHKFWYLLNYAYKGNPYQSFKQNGQWHNSHQRHVQNMRIVRNARSHDPKLKFLADENNNHRFLYLELAALVLLTFDLSKGEGLKFKPETGGKGPEPLKPGGKGPEPPKPGGNGPEPPKPGGNGPEPPKPGGNGTEPPKPGGNGTEPPKPEGNGTEPPKPGGNGTDQGGGIEQKVPTLLDKLKAVSTRTWKMIAAAAAVILLLFIAVPAMLPGNGTKKEQAVQTSPTMMPSLEGFYYLKVTNGDTQEGTLRTCQVREYGNNTARVLVTSDYDPEVYEFTYSDDGTLYSSDLGSGKMTYNKRLDRIVLTFKKDDTTWEFTN